MLRKRIVGQDEAIDKVGDIIRLTKSSLDLKPVRPDGVFLFIGPTGVGKTELARVLAEILFDDEGKMIRLDMSEYMEPHSVSKIIGSPPGYIGSDQEGGLTGRVRTEPYSIILLDEVEKAHPDVLNIFLQVFEDGRMTDSQGRTAYFSSCTIIMTSNVGATRAFTQKREIGFNESIEIDFKGTEKLIRESIRKHFTPEFINRVDEIVYFKPLDKNAIKKIAELKLREIENRFAGENKKIKISDSVLDLISEKGYNPEYGARYLNRTIEDLVLKPLSKIILAKPEQKRFMVKLDKKENITITGGVK
jgi:ATP-dependent Clp protease ATP-binding subunit ClpC